MSLFSIPSQRGYDANKKVNGRKRHVLVDTLGLLLVAVVHSASSQDRHAATDLLLVLKHRFSRLRLIWADGGYTGELIEWIKTVRQRRRLRIEVVKREPTQAGFPILPRR